MKSEATRVARATLSQNMDTRMSSIVYTIVERALERWRRGGTRPRRHSFSYEHVLGTSLELQVVAAEEEAAFLAEEAALGEIDRLEPILSGWSPTSELSRWLATHDEEIAISRELTEVLAACDEWRELTSGAFDPAAQAIVEALRVGGNASRLSLDGPRWTLDRATARARRLSRHAISLDAIAKGYIVSHAAGLARAVPGIEGVLLNVGGDIQHFGARPVSIGVADPFAPAENAPPLAVVRVRDAALATSGGYRRGFSIDGRRVSHIVDPRTGAPAEKIASASVLASDCAAADALSTAFSVMEPEESVALADTLAGVGCLLVVRDGTVVTNATWDAHVLPANDHNEHGRHRDGKRIA